MRKEEHTILYCTILSAGQWDFLLDCKAAINRQKCLYRLMTAAVRTKTVLHIKGVEIALEVDRQQHPMWNWLSIWAATARQSENSSTVLTGSVC